MIGYHRSARSTFWLFFLMLVLAIGVHSLTAPLSVGPSYKYSQGASSTFNTAPYYLSGTGSINLVYDFLFWRTMNTSSYKSFITVDNFYGQLTSLFFDFLVSFENQTPTKLQIRITSTKMNKISSLRFRYLVVEQAWGTFYDWQVDYTIAGGISISPGNSHSYLSTSKPSINMTGTIFTYHVILGFDVRCGTSNELSILLDVVRTSSTRFTATISTLASTGFTLYGLSFSQVSINVGQINAIPGRLTYGTFSANNNNTAGLSYLDVGNITRNFNAIVGLRGFHTKNEAFVSWNSSITPETSITGSSSNNFLYLQFSYLIIEQNWCGPPTPYLMIATSTCYDVCLTGRYGSWNPLTCEPCLYDCEECISGNNCTSCNDTTDFRVMNNATSRCVPMPGYYQTGVAVAGACKVNCSSCTSLSVCTGCITGFSLISSNCIQCPANCQTCTSTTVCTVCISPYSISGSTCVLNCSLALENCTACVDNSGIIQCTICELGFYLDPVDKNCSVVCGDGILASIEECDDNNTDNGDGCDSFCVIEPAYYCLGTVGNTSTCGTCETNCLNCSSATNCSVCDTLYVLNDTSCVPDCSNTSNCQTCQVVVSYVQCLTCVTGYIINASDLCETVCGDGLVMGSQGCDDNNTIDGDGCSSFCMVQSQYFCQGAPSTCYPCVQYCLECVDNTSCTICNSLTVWDNATSSCQANCSVISNCSTCNVSSVSGSDFVQCFTCFGGYSVDNSNVCRAICGDGLVAPEEGCDDNNTIDGDGCSALCTIQTSYFCQGAPSSCYPCVQYCLDCIDNTSCTTCNALTLWNSSDATCDANCSVISNCSQCTVSTGFSGDFVECSSCSGGYSVDSSSNTCKPICGDGILAPQEACEDGNLDAGDGCDSNCAVQNFFKCNASLTSTISQCFLTQLDLKLETIIKTQGQNSGVLTYQPQPEGLKIYENIDWTSVVEITTPGITIKNINYNKETGKVVVQFDYSQNIGDQNITLKMNTANDSTLADLQTFQISNPAVSTNNAALVYYQDSSYGIASISKYLAIMLAVLSIIFIVAGLFGGRLIGLECSGLIQLTFLCLLTLEDLSPTLSSLGMLHYSLGYNNIKPYDSSQNIDRPFVAQQINSHYIYNYNIMAIMVAIPALSALVCRIIASRTEDPQDKQKWLRRARLAIGQYTLYLYLCFSYLSSLSLIVQVKYLGGNIMDYIGIVQGVLFLFCGVGLAILYCRSEDYFTQFKQKFRKEVACGNRFYLFPMIQRLISPAALVVLSSKSYGTAPIIAIYTGLLVTLLIVKPYKGKRMNFRPVANSIVMILIAAIFLGIAFMNDPSGVLSLYGPFMIMALLLVSVVYSAYALIQDFRSKCAEGKQQPDTDRLFQMEMNKITSKMIHENNQSMLGLRKQSLITNDPNDDGLDSDDSRITTQRQNLRRRLTEMKNKNSPQRKSSDCEEVIRKQTGLSDFLEGLDLEQL